MFTCGKPALDDWLRNRALKAEGRSARTYVICAPAAAVVGYYSFAAGGVRPEDLPKGLRRNMPPIVPVTLLARLAVDYRHHGAGLGKGLLKDGLIRALRASQVIGSAAILVHALDEEAGRFYTRYGFLEFPENSRTLFLPMDAVAKAL
jgi:GNAT superfamily N-acetyltransferase